MAKEPSSYMIMDERGNALWFGTSKDGETLLRDQDFHDCVLIGYDENGEIIDVVPLPLTSPAEERE